MNESHNLIHYLCVKGGYVGLAYASTMLHFAFNEYSDAVSKLTITFRIKHSPKSQHLDISVELKIKN